MKLNNIEDIDEFLDVIDECSGDVILSSDEGDRINLRGRLGAYLSVASLISNGYISELLLSLTDDEDMARLEPYIEE